MPTPLESRITPAHNFDALLISSTFQSNVIFTASALPMPKFRYR